MTSANQDRRRLLSVSDTRAYAEDSDEFSNLARQSLSALSSAPHLSLPLRQRMKQVPNRKQCQTENSTPEVEVVTDTMLRAPVQTSGVLCRSLTASESSFRLGPASHAHGLSFLQTYSPHPDGRCHMLFHWRPATRTCFLAS